MKKIITRRKIYIKYKKLEDKNIKFSKIKNWKFIKRYFNKRFIKYYKLKNRIDEKRLQIKKENNHLNQLLSISLLFQQQHHNSCYNCNQNYKSSYANHN